ncbi:hypothetical protein Ancab_030248 [Ancistrocladus abbreviatus]
MNSLNPKFRNYVPRDKQLQERKLAPPELPKFEDAVLAAPPPEKKEVRVTSSSQWLGSKCLD